MLREQEILKSAKDAQVSQARRMKLQLVELIQNKE